MLLNILSTGVMAKMGKIYGNYMINLRTTNKKLIDRATRIISDLCKVDYVTANYELFLTKLMLEEENSGESQVKITIDRLQRRKNNE
jgi:N-acetylmuramic acid 6-phosphate etherase